jgi:signal transduction histidine kinase
MRNSQWLGLLASGPMSQALFRIENLHIHLGPVASASLRVASRLANRLKAGKAGPLAQLQEAELILVTGPDADFEELLALALSPEMDWSGRTAIFLDFHRDSSDLAPLRERGASTGTLDFLDSFADPHFVADADHKARRRLESFAAATKCGIFHLTPGRKQFFAAGSAFTGTLFTPLVAATVDCLKKAGLTQPDALQIMERNTLQTLRSWMKSGRKGWTGTLAEGDVEATRRQLQALQAENELLSDYFSNTAHLALLLFGEDAGWLRGLAEAPPDPRKTPIMEAMDDSQAQRLVAAGRLAANLAHDWNNLLTLLAAQTGEIAHSLPQDHPAQALTAELKNSITHAADSPRRLLSWLREESGQHANASMNDAIRGSLPLLQLALGGRVLCVLELDERVPAIPLDEPLLRNALLNLASNAAKAMNSRGTFTIRTAFVENYIQLTVSDTGSGMEEETRRRVFEPFFTTGQASGGTGLGLETVSNMATSHNASMEIQTAPGEGCRFMFRVPVPGFTAVAEAGSL